MLAVLFLANSTRRGDNPGAGVNRVPTTRIRPKARSLDEKANPHSPGRNEQTREALTAALAEAQRELAEGRRREAATAAVLNVISRSKVNLDTVLATLTE